MRGTCTTVNQSVYPKAPSTFFCSYDSLKKVYTSHTYPVVMFSVMNSESDQEEFPSTCEMSVMINFNNLPNELIAEIIRHLSIPDRLVVRQLNRKWRQLSWTHITEFFVGLCDQAFNDMPIPEHKLKFSDNRKQEKTFQLLIQERGHSLQYLFFSDKGYWYTVPNSWNQLLSSLPHYCPNLVGLCIHLHSDITSDTKLALFKHYGSQLKIVWILDFEYELNLTDFAIQHFNPERLRVLYCPLMNLQNLNKLVNHFPLLTSLTLSGCWEKDKLDFSPLNRLAHLKSLAFSDENPVDHFDLWNQMPFVHRLQTLHLNRQSREPDYDFQSIRNLSSLRVLSISSGKMKNLLIFLSLQNLKCLHLNMIVRSESDYELVAKVLQMLSKMNKLKELRTFFDFTLHKFQSKPILFLPMPFVTCFHFQFVGTHDNSDETRHLVQQLPSIFPNLTDFGFYWNKMRYNVLIDCINRLPKLRNLDIQNGKYVKDLQKFCIQKQINANFFFLGFFY